MTKKVENGDSFEMEGRERQEHTSIQALLSLGLWKETNNAGAMQYYYQDTTQISFSYILNFSRHACPP
jgi:hypothetical protein